MSCPTYLGLPGPLSSADLSSSIKTVNVFLFLKSSHTQEEVLLSCATASLDLRSWLRSFRT